jgi:hypothetical protein
MSDWRVDQKLRRILLAGVCATGLVGFPAAGMGQDSKVEAHQGVAVGRDLNTGGGSITIGLTPEQVRDAMLAVLHEQSSAQAKIDDLSQKLDVTGDAVVEFFRILGQKDVVLEKLPEILAQIAARHREMLDRLAALHPEDPAVKVQIEEAQAAIQAGDYDRADRLLSEAESSDVAAIRIAEKLARQAQEAADQRRVSAAATRVERGELSLTPGATHEIIQPEERACSRHSRRPACDAPAC